MAADRSDEERAHNATKATDSAPQQDHTSSENSGSAADDGSRKRSASPAEDKMATVSHVDEGAASTSDPPLPAEEAPPLPEEAPPEDDGWTHHWDSNAGTYYFYNRLSGKSQWENPRVPETASTSHGSYDRYATSSAAGPATSSGAPGISSPPRRRYGGYNPAIHGDYDPNADYALEAQRQEEEEEAAAASAAATAAGLPDPNQDYTLNAHFNRFTGRFQPAGMNPDYHNDENKSRRQMNAFFDVDAAANSHDGRSLKAERRGKQLSKKELKQFKNKRREKKEEKRRAWLRD